MAASRENRVASAHAIVLGLANYVNETASTHVDRRGEPRDKAGFYLVYLQRNIQKAWDATFGADAEYHLPARDLEEIWGRLLRELGDEIQRVTLVPMTGTAWRGQTPR